MSDDFDFDELDPDLLAEADDQEFDGTPSGLEEEPEQDTAAAKSAASGKKATAKPAAKRRTPVRRARASRLSDSDQTVAQRLKAGKQVKIMLHEQEDAPPGGVPVSINGYMYRILPGKWVTVPIAVEEILRNAVESRAVVDGDKRIIGHRQVPRFPYSVQA